MKGGAGRPCPPDFVTRNMTHGCAEVLLNHMYLGAGACRCKRRSMGVRWSTGARPMPRILAAPCMGCGCVLSPCFDGEGALMTYSVLHALQIFVFGSVGAASARGSCESSLQA